MTPIRRALLSVSDKTGLIALAQALAAYGAEILSTGGSARTLRDAGVSVTEVADHTGFPEIMDGHNVADFLAPDKDIMEELERLEEEEARRDEADGMEGEEMEGEELTEEDKAARAEIRWEGGEGTSLHVSAA